MFGITPKSYKILLSIIEKYSAIEQVIIFGSRAKGTYTEGSDIDITLIGDISKNEFYSFKTALEESSIPYLFDVSIYNELTSDDLKEHIKRVGKVLYQKKK